MKGPLGHLIGQAGVKDGSFLPKAGHRKRSSIYERIYALGMDDGYRIGNLESVNIRERIERYFDLEFADEHMVEMYRQGFLEGRSFSRLSKVSGRRFTPAEQRTLIDEDGRARNADRLRLEGTHYQDYDDDDAIRYQDSSLFF